MNIRISWHMLILALVFAGLVVLGVLEIGPPSSSARTSKEMITAEDGVVQSTVTGTGNVEPSTDVEANFQTSGVLQHVYVSVGEHVVKGQLLATLDPTSAQLTVDQAEDQLSSAQDDLTNAENETVSTSSSSSTTSTSAPVDAGEDTDFVAYTPGSSTTTTTSTGTTPTTTTPTTTTPTRTTTTPTTTTPSRSGTSRGSGSESSRSSSSSSTGSSSTGSGSTGSSSTGSGSSGSGSSGAVSAATKAANVASAEASVDSAEASVSTAENTLHETHLYAPATGTVVSVESLSPGDTVSSTSSSSSSSSDTGSTGSSSTGSGSSGATTAGGLGDFDSSSSSSSSGSSSSSSGFAEIVSTGSLTMTVPFSESDISQVKVGQPANVTLEALTGVELAGHVSSISTLGTSSDGVVSYDATITIDQHSSQVKPGMSASVSVITAQADGVNLPSTAITGSSGSVSRVNVVSNGKEVSTPVVVGLVGTSRTQIVSGLKAGQQVEVTETLPSLSTSSSSTGSSSTGTLGGSTGVGGGAARFLGGGSGGFFGGGGGFRGGG